MSFATTAPCTFEEALNALLCSGGDDRIQLSPDGVNEYGCPLTPVPGLVELGSCTSSTPSPLAYEAAARLFLRLHHFPGGSSRCRDVIAEQYEAVRHSLLSHLRVPGHDVDVFLCPSGTDAEYVATWLACGDQSSPLTNILVGPADVGRGAVYACGGLHYGTRPPLGRRHRGAGTRLEGFRAGQVATHPIEVRDDRGGVRPLAAVDQEVAAVADEAIRRGRRVLVHLVAHSKTGIHAPGVPLLRSLKDRFPDRVTVTVDAAQGRCSFGQIRAWLGSGFSVIFTASKFYGGPPFSGVLLVPAAESLDARGCPPLAGGLDSIVATGDLPPRLRRFGEHLTHASNPGLLVRWAAGLAEIDRYHAVAADLRHAVLRRLTSVLREELAACGFARFPPDGPREESNEHLAGFEEHRTPSVVSFAVTSRTGRTLGAQALKRLNQGRVFHLGQPVVLDPGAGASRTVTRAAIGAAMIAGVAERSGGDSARLDREVAAFRDTIRELGNRVAALASMHE